MAFPQGIKGLPPTHHSSSHELYGAFWFCRGMTYHRDIHTGVQGHRGATLNTLCLSYGVHLETISDDDTFGPQAAPGKISSDVPGKGTRDIRVGGFW